MSAAIKVLGIRRIDGNGNLKAFANVKLGCIEIYGCRIIQQPGQKAWVALPQVQSRTKADGSGAGWFAVNKITNPKVKADLDAAVLEAWERGS